MKRRAHTALLVACLATPAAAQDGRFSFELGAARGTSSAIFEQTVVDNGTFPSTSVTRLTLVGGSLGAARIGYRIAGPWTLVADLAHGSARYDYTHAISSPNLGGGGLSEWTTGGATRTTFGLAVAHRTRFAALPLSVEPEVGFALHRLTVGNPGVQCVPQPPTLGGLPEFCVSSEPWEQVYSVPSMGAGLSLGYTIAPKVAVELRGAYAVGRTSTEKGFYVDLIPQYDYAEAPKSRVIRSTQLSLGLRIEP